jgi:hypothetical protein
VGIDDYPFRGSDLKGCVNDANAWASLLVEHFDFTKSDVHVLTNGQATKSAYVEGLKSLVRGARPGDVLVFTNSSHGSYVADRDGDEEVYDEMICPHDVRDNPLVDDELRELFNNVGDDVHLTVIFDCCFAGTATRDSGGPKLPGDPRIRFLGPAVRGATVLESPRPRSRRAREHPESEMKELLIAASGDRDYAYETCVDGTVHGNMTRCALRAIREAKYRLTYTGLVERLTCLMAQTGYPQRPRLEGRAENKGRYIFA